MNTDISGIIANIERNLKNVQSANDRIEDVVKAHTSLSSRVAVYVSSLKQLEEQTEKLYEAVEREREADGAALRAAADECVKASDSMADAVTRALAGMTEISDGRRAEDVRASAMLKDACDNASANFLRHLDNASAAYEDKLAEMAVALEEDRAENKINFDQQLAALQAKLTTFQSTARSLVDAIGIVSQLDDDILRLKEDSKAQKNSIEKWHDDLRHGMESEFDSVHSGVAGCRQGIESESRQLRDCILKNAKDVEKRQDEQALRLTMLSRDLRNVKIYIYVLLALSIAILVCLLAI